MPPAERRRFGSGAAVALGLLLFALGASFVPLVAAATWLGAGLRVAQQFVAAALAAAAAALAAAYFTSSPST